MRTATASTMIAADPTSGHAARPKRAREIQVEFGLILTVRISIRRQPCWCTDGAWWPPGLGVGPGRGFIVKVRWWQQGESAQCLP